MIMYTILPSIVCLDLVLSCSMSSVISSPTSLDWKLLEYVLLSVYNACRSFMIKRLILCYIFQCPSLILHQWAESLIDSLRICIISLLSVILLVILWIRHFLESLQMLETLLWTWYQPWLSFLLLLQASFWFWFLLLFTTLNSSVSTSRHPEKSSD